MSTPRIVFCSNNHIYDASLYDVCPYCSKIEEEQKELVMSTAAGKPDAEPAEESWEIDPFSEDYTVRSDNMSAEGPVLFPVPETENDDPYAETVIGDRKDSPAAETVSENPLDKTVKGNGLPSDAAAENSCGISEDPDEEELQEQKIPFFTKDGIPDPRNIDTSMEFAEGILGKASQEERMTGKVPQEERMTGEASQEERMTGKVPQEERMTGEASQIERITGKASQEEDNSADGLDVTVSEKGAWDDAENQAADTISEKPAENPFGGSDTLSAGRNYSAAASEAEADSEEHGARSDYENEWEQSLLKEGPVRGWFVFLNGVQKHHSIELCRKSMFIYEYDGMCLVLSEQMENMTLLAAIEQYRTISIIPEAGVPFEVNGEAKRSCGRLVDYMELLIGSHRMVYVPVDERILSL